MYYVTIEISIQIALEKKSKNLKGMQPNIFASLIAIAILVNYMNLTVSQSTRIKHQHEAISFLIEGISKCGLLKQFQLGKWSIHENVAHLAGYQTVFIERIELILQNTTPQFDPYRADDDPEFLILRELPLKTLLEKIDTDRNQITATLKVLSAPQLKQIGIHKRYGKLTLED